MRAFAFVMCSALLTGCSQTADTLDVLKGAGQTASGALHEGIERGKSAVEGVQEMVDDAKQRIDQVQEGMDLMMEGKEKINEAIQ